MRAPSSSLATTTTASSTLRPRRRPRRLVSSSTVSSTTVTCSRSAPPDLLRNATSARATTTLALATRLARTARRRLTAARSPAEALPRETGVDARTKKETDLSLCGSLPLTLYEFLGYERLVCMDLFEILYKNTQPYSPFLDTTLFTHNICFVIFLPRRGALQAKKQYSRIFINIQPFFGYDAALC